MIDLVSVMLCACVVTLCLMAVVVLEAVVVGAVGENFARYLWEDAWQWLVIFVMVSAVLHGFFLRDMLRARGLLLWMHAPLVCLAMGCALSSLGYVGMGMLESPAAYRSLTEAGLYVLIVGVASVVAVFVKWIWLSYPLALGLVFLVRRLYLGRGGN